MGHTLHRTIEPGFFEGKLLVSTPILDGSSFERSLVYVFLHDAQGAMGITVNQVIKDMQSSFLAQQLKIDPIEVTKCIPVYFGGPIESGKGFILHDAHHHGHMALKVTDNIAISSNIQLLKEILSGIGPERHLFALGYSGWSAGQLEEEIKRNHWIALPPDEELIFGEEGKEKWNRAGKMHGIDLKRVSPYIGCS